MLKSAVQLSVLFSFLRCCCCCALITAESIAAKQYSVYLTLPLHMGVTVRHSEEERWPSSRLLRSARLRYTTAHPAFSQRHAPTDGLMSFVCGSRRNQRNTDFSSSIVRSVNVRLPKSKGWIQTWRSLFVCFSPLFLSDWCEYDLARDSMRAIVQHMRNKKTLQYKSESWYWPHTSGVQHISRENCIFASYSKYHHAHELATRILF